MGREDSSLVFSCSNLQFRHLQKHMSRQALNVLLKDNKELWCTAQINWPFFHHLIVLLLWHESGWSRNRGDRVSSHLGASPHLSECQVRTHTARVINTTQPVLTIGWNSPLTNSGAHDSFITSLTVSRVSTACLWSDNLNIESVLEFLPPQCLMGNDFYKSERRSSLSVPLKPRWLNQGRKGRKCGKILESWGHFSPRVWMASSHWMWP